MSPKDAVADFGLRPPGPPQSVLDILHATAAANALTGNQLALARGGTNIGSYTPGDLFYASSSDVLTKLDIGSAAEVLTVSSGLPSWESPGTPGAHTLAVAAVVVPMRTLPLSSIRNPLPAPESPRRSR